MSLRQKLLLLFSLPGRGSSRCGVDRAGAHSSCLRERDQEETALFVSQFQREFQHRSAEVAAAVNASPRANGRAAMAFELIQSGDALLISPKRKPWPRTRSSIFLRSWAQTATCQFRAVAGALWLSGARRNGEQPSFLKREDLPDGSTALGLFAVRAIRRSDGRAACSVLVAAGSTKLPRRSPCCARYEIWLYSVAGPSANGSPDASGSFQAAGAFDGKRLVGANGDIAARLAISR